MKRCPNCSHENKDTANFCIRCGARLDKRCPRCGNAVEEDALFCPVCGARLDGKKPCPACGTVNDPDAAFCEKCGTALSDGGRVAPTAPAAPNPVPIPPAGTGSAASPAAGGQRISAQSANAGAAGTKSPFIAALSPRLLEMIRAGATLCFSLILFILSFFGVCKANMAYELQSDDFQTPYAVEITATDVIGGAFAWIDPPSADDRMQDFIIYIAEHLDPGEIPDAQDPGYAYALLGREMLEKYNPIKFAATEEAAEYSPNTVTELWIAAVFCLAYILFSAAFFVASAVDFAFVLRGRKRIKAPLRLAVLSLAALLLSVFYLSGVFSAGWSGMAGAGIAAIVFALAAIAVEIACRILTARVAANPAGAAGTAKRKTPFSHILALLSAASGGVFALVALILASGAAVSVVCTLSPYTSNVFLPIREGYSATSLSDALSMLLAARDNPDLYGSAGEVIGSIGYDPLRRYSVLAPSNMCVMGVLTAEVPLAVLGVLCNLFFTAFAVAGVLALADSARAAFDGKRTRKIYAVLLPVFALLLIALVSAYCLLVNACMEDSKAVWGFEYSAKPSSRLIAAGIFVLLFTAQRVVFGILTKKAERAESAGTAGTAGIAGNPGGAPASPLSAPYAVPADAASPAVGRGTIGGPEKTEDNFSRGY